MHCLHLPVVCVAARCIVMQQGACQKQASNLRRMVRKSDITGRCMQHATKLVRQHALAEDLRLRKPLREKKNKKRSKCR